MNNIPNCCYFRDVARAMTRACREKKGGVVSSATQGIVGRVCYKRQNERSHSYTYDNIVQLFILASLYYLYYKYIFEFMQY